MIVTVRVAGALTVLMSNVPLVVPAGIVTVAGTLARDALLLESVTCVSVGGAATRTTVPLSDNPPGTAPIPSTTC